MNFYKTQYPLNADIWGKTTILNCLALGKTYLPKWPYCYDSCFMAKGWLGAALEQIGYPIKSIRYRFEWLA